MAGGFIRFMEEISMNIAVYLGSSLGNDRMYQEAAAELGAWIGDHGHTLVYGGSKSGLMGVLAGNVVMHGGKVIGVEPDFLMERNAAFDGVTKLIRVHTMAERKEKMKALGDAYIAFPGGVGTLDEISEIFSDIRLKRNDKPCILYNLTGYYDPLREMLKRMVSTGFLEEAELEQILFLNNLAEIAAVLHSDNWVFYT